MATTRSPGIAPRPRFSEDSARCAGRRSSGARPSTDTSGSRLRWVCSTCPPAPGWRSTRSWATRATTTTSPMACRRAAATECSVSPEYLPQRVQIIRPGESQRHQDSRVLRRLVVRIDHAVLLIRGEGRAILRAAARARGPYDEHARLASIGNGRKDLVAEVRVSRPCIDDRLGARLHEGVVAGAIDVRVTIDDVHLWQGLDLRDIEFGLGRMGPRGCAVEEWLVFDNISQRPVTWTGRIG